ncbi:MAG: BlaI/MecI/CopY family transcriptional regulator [Planctomycetota bacterium]|nr:BlaI/MecI/CopY family transcriptional regulator [Planctomycetota bacterium]
MPKAPGISEAEWDVMKVVWDHEPVAASDVADRLAAERDWHPQTVKTMLTRLVGKGALAYKAEGKRYLYRARISRDACVRHESRSFLSRVFDGSVTPAVVHLLTHSNLSDDELKQLRRILDGGDTSGK